LLKASARARAILNKLSGPYARRLLGIYTIFPKRSEAHRAIDGASLEKLAKMLRVLGFLAQTKVYLFWRNPAYQKKAVIRKPHG
jgi:hypothetical protein